MLNTIFFTSYILFSFICFNIDYFFTNVRLDKPDKNTIIKHYNKMLPNVSQNLILGSLFFYISEKIYNPEKYNNNYFIINFILWLCLTDILFYISHYAFHSKKLYFLHSKHHDFHYTYALGAIYAHPLDFLIVNLLPTTIPIFVFSIPINHINIIILFSVFTTTIISHGGYIEDQNHLTHHLKRTSNYGLLFSDIIFGTYK